MRIFDCFTFFNEFDLLDIRLAELSGVVDRFVLVEADRTHAGRTKPLYFEEQRHRYEHWGDRITSFVVRDMPPYHGDPWPLERHQRNRIGDSLATLGCDDDDIVLLSDVDEIPCAAALPAALDMVRRRDYAVFVQRLYRFFLNNVTRDDEHLCGWCGTVAFRYRELARHKAERVRGRWCNGGQFYRHAGWSRRRRCVPDAGWHFTSMGGRRLVDYKLQSFAHPDLADPAADRVERAWMRGTEQPPGAAAACSVYLGTCACGCTWKHRPQQYAPPGSREFVEAVSLLPQHLREHLEHFPGLIRPATGATEPR